MPCTSTTRSRGASIADGAVGVAADSPDGCARRGAGSMSTAHPARTPATRRAATLTAWAQQGTAQCGHRRNSLHTSRLIVTPSGKCATKSARSRVACVER